MELPQHIADMCGIVSAKTQSQMSKKEFEVITKEIGEDGIVQISHRDKVIGWISSPPDGEGDGLQVRALTSNGRIDRFYTSSQAMGWLISEAF